MQVEKNIGIRTFDFWTKTTLFIDGEITKNVPFLNAMEKTRNDRGKETQISVLTPLILS